MMINDDYLASSMSSANLMESNYTLALKFFMNKNFAKSFDILKGQYPHLFQNLLSGVIEEPIFIKVLNLYLTEVGLILQSSHEFKVSKAEKGEIIRQLDEDYILNNLLSFYKDLNDVPPEILYNLYLISYIGLDLKDSHRKLLKVYGMLNFDRMDDSDRYSKKLVELLAVRILPELQLYSDAKQLISENPLLVNKQEYLSHVNALEHDDLAEKDQKERNKQRQAREQQQRQQQEKLDKDLKYRSLKQIKETQQPLNKEVDRPARTPNNNDLNALKEKLLFNLNFSKTWLKEHSPLILLAMLAFFVSKRVFKAKKIDVVKNLKETLGMAFKISYL